MRSRRQRLPGSCRGRGAGTAHANAGMHAPPGEHSLRLVCEVTGEALQGLTRDAFIARVRRLLAHQRKLEAPPAPDEHGTIRLTLGNIGMGSAILQAVLDAERRMRLN
jgi:hypothetical protein